jgi:cephalosporin-C deacetylase
MAVPGLERFRPNAYRPANFLNFWEKVRDEVADCRPDPEFGEPEAAGPGIELKRLTFASVGGIRIQGYLARPQSVQARPLIVHAHGYNDRYTIMTEWARAGAAVFGFDARGFGRSADAVDKSRHGYVLTGIESPATSIIRGAVADYLQAIRTAQMLLDGRAASVTCQGFSFGAALALMGAALSEHAGFLAVGQPTFGWNAERRRVALAGSTREINQYVAAHPKQGERVMDTLEYFDTVHFAPLVRCPALVGIGLDDDVVPSRTVLAVVNHMRCPLELRLLPVSHSDDPRESLWRDFGEEWLRYTTDGLPKDFGAADRQIRTLVA